MGKLLWFLAGLAIIANLFEPAVAEKISGFVGGNELFESCKSDNVGVQNICRGYIVGVVDAFDAQRIICTPENVSADQVRDIVVKWLRDHPENRHLQAATLVKAAIPDSWSCPAR
jgi:hypothetical protein